LVRVIHFVRHCDVENLEGIVYGRLAGFQLSAVGRGQADRLGEYFAERQITALFSSPLLRATQTARAIRSHHSGLMIRTSRRLQEVRTSYQGLREKDVPASVNMFDNPRDASDESIADVYRRMEKFLDWLRRGSVAQVCQKGEIICVSHQAPIAILRAGLEDRPLVVTSLRGPHEPKKGSVTTLTFQASDTPAISYHDVVS